MIEFDGFIDPVRRAPCVGVGIEVNEGKWPEAARVRLEQRITDKLVATHGDEEGSRIENAPSSSCDLFDDFVRIAIVEVDIAQIGASKVSKRIIAARIGFEVGEP